MFNMVFIYDKYIEKMDIIWTSRIIETETGKKKEKETYAAVYILN